MRARICRGRDRDGTRCAMPTTSATGYCPVHGESFGARFRPATRKSNMYASRAWRRLREQVIAEWVSQHGWVCPGWRVPAHAARSFAVDHVVPLVAGGAGMDRANLRVLCGRCNSRKSLKDRQ